MAASSGSDFARAQLIKYGWKEGKGLGKHENGIASAIKPKLKFDNHGLGHDNGLEYKCFWWNQVFNKAASNIVVENTDNDVSINVISNNKKRKRTKTEDKFSKYNSFVKAEALESNNVQESDDKCNDDTHINSNLPDDILEKCGGRTAYKAARHGLTMNAKLTRLQKQEESFAGPKEKITNKKNKKLKEDKIRKKMCTAN